MEKRGILIKIWLLVAMIAASVFILPQAEVWAQQKTYKWVGQAFCGRAIRIFEHIDQMIFMVDKYTDGRLKVECKQAGELVPASQVYEAAMQGVVDFGHGCPCLTRAKAYALQFFCDAPGAQSPIEEIIWFYNGGGKEIFEDLFHRYYKLHPIPVTFFSSEIWVFSNKKINSLKDLKGLKMRAAGVRADVLQAMGMSVVILPGDEIVPAMQKGVIDAMEYGGLHITYPIGFNDVTKYLYYHPRKSTSPMNLWAVNLKKWNELPDDIKKMVERASRDAALRSLTWDLEQDFLYMKKAVEEKKNEVLTLPEEVARAVDEAAADFYYKKAQTDKDLARILDSWAKFKKDYGKYAKWLDYFNMTGDRLGLVKGGS